MTHRSEEDFRSIAENAPSLILRFDKELRHVYVNPAVEHTFGLSSRAMIGKTHFELGLPESVSRLWTDALRHVFQTGEKSTLEYELETSGGRLSYRSRLVPEFDRNGAVVSVLVVADDVTDVKRTEQTLRLSEERYRRFFEEDLSGNFISTPDGKLLACNPSFAKIFGYATVEEALGQNASLLYTSKEERKVLLQLLKKKKKLINVQRQMKKKDGTFIRVVANVSGEFDGRGELVQLHGFVLDETERHMAEERLAQSVQQFRKVFEEGPIGMALVTPTFRLLKANESLCRMLGYTEEELLEKPIQDFTHPDDLARDLDLATRLVRGEIPSYQTEKRYITKDGRTIWGLLTASLLHDQSGIPMLGIGMVEDITERKQAQEALQKSEERYREFLHQSSEGIWRFELEQRIPLNLPEEEQIDLFYRYAYLAECNDHVAKMYGYAQAEEIIGARLEDLLVRSEPKNVEYLRSFIRSEYRLTDAESHEVDRLGRPRYFLNNLVGIIEDGKLVRSWGSQRDITERKVAIELLRQSEEKYRSLFEDTKDVVFISTPDGRFLDMNQAGVEVFGYASKEELLKVDIAKDLYVDSEERIKVGKILAEQGFVKDYPTLAKRKDGKQLIVLETTTAVRNESGEVVAYRGIIRDVTEQRRLEEQLRQAQKMESIGALAGGIAHDFNNILNIILGYISDLEHPGIDSERRSHHLDAVRTAVERGSGLVRQLLTFARKTTGVFSSVNVNETILETSKLLAETFPQSIRFELNLSAHPDRIQADESQLQQAILNLCVNARDALLDSENKHGVIRIGTELVDAEAMHRRFPEAWDQAYVLIAVSDTGVGMDETTKNRIFEPFFTTKELGKGTGLGLAVVYGVVNAHHGFVDVESLKGEGTSIRLFLPTEQDSGRSPAATGGSETNGAPTERVGRGETILLIEDETMLLELLQSLFEDNGFRVLVARDGLEAVSIYAKHWNEIDLVLSDMGLPKLGGWEAFLRMKEINPNVKSILASGYLDTVLRTDLIKAGAVDFVQKPYVPEKILAQIRAAIDGVISSKSRMPGT